MQAWISRGLVLVLVVLFVAGCGRSNRPKLGQVTGTVSYRGQPIASGSLVFEVSGARPATAKIANGQITEVTTFDLNDGVPIGQARIAVFATEGGGAPPAAAPPPSDPGAYKAPGADYMGGGAKPLVPPKFNDPSTSGLTWDIKEGKNAIKLELTD
jgi:hypothetical protein